MILKHALVFDDAFNPVSSDIAVDSEWITEVGPGLSGADSLDLSGQMIVPGFIDIHIHGCMGADTCDGTRQAIETIARHLVENGVTSFCPATMTIPPEQLKHAILTVRDCMLSPPDGAAVCGVNMEGPYISAHKKGAQAATDIRVPDLEEFTRLYEETGRVIRLLDLAPECAPEGFIEGASKLCRISVAHSSADYDEVRRAFSQGARHATHLYNAMTGFSHRAPGAVGAVLEDERVTAELICDGQHLHPSVLRTSFRLLGDNRAVIISDSMRAAGLPDGVSELGGQPVFVKNGHALLEDGTIAGSTTNLLAEIKNLLQFGIPFRQILRAATINPATVLGLEDSIGSIRAGKRADLVVLDQNYDISMVIARGAVVYRRRQS